jgi:hypothetical protein
MNNRWNGLTNLFICLFVVSSSFPITAASQRKSSLEGRVKSLEQLVNKMSGEQRTLEARIAVLEQLHLTPSPEVLRQAYITSNKDAIISQLSNLSANAYQYRIRPTTMGGGGGSYEGYKIPRMMAATEVASYTSVVYPNLIILIGISKIGLGSVKGTLCDDGRVLEWEYSGEFE